MRGFFVPIKKNDIKRVRNMNQKDKVELLKRERKKIKIIINLKLD